MAIVVRDRLKSFLVAPICLSRYFNARYDVLREVHVLILLYSSVNARAWAS